MIDDSLTQLRRALARDVAAEMRKSTEMVHQRDSRLGRNTHIKAAKERAARVPKEDGVLIVGNNYWLSTAALEEEARRLFLARAEAPRKAAARPDESGIFEGAEVDEFRASLRRTLGGK